MCEWQSKTGTEDQTRKYAIYTRHLQLYSYLISRTEWFFFLKHKTTRGAASMVKSAAFS